MLNKMKEFGCDAEITFNHVEHSYNIKKNSESKNNGFKDFTEWFKMYWCPVRYFVNISE